MVYLFELLINLALSYIHTSAVGPDLTKFCNFGEIKKSLMISRLNAQNVLLGRSNLSPGITCVPSPLHVQPGEDDQDEHRGNGQHARTGQTGQRQNPHCFYL